MTPVGGAGPGFDVPLETADDLYHLAPCGYLSALPDGTVVRVNRTLLEWTGHREEDLLGTRFVELLGPGGRIFHETHYMPLLMLQAEVREIAFDLRCADGRMLPVLVNSRVAADPAGEPMVIRITVYDATIRHEYEQELLRARRRAEESEARVRHVADSLQRSLMQGSLTDGPGYTVETRYRPAVESLEVGGDWHDAFCLPDDTLAVSVGDVVGRGITAACAMGQVRSAIRAIAASAPSPGPLLDQLDTFVEGVPDAKVATVVYARLDTRTGDLRYACAGHLPPLVVGPDGEVELLWAGRSLPLGVANPGGSRSEGTVRLLPGSKVLLYTDGLIERRDRDIDEALDTLVAAVRERVDRSAADLVDEVTEALLADEVNRDDVCVLCLDYLFAPQD